ncbi:TerB N-terminal domain-containing protein [Paenibacillus sp. DYY-L-2]|uniref:TerB N-terminal domain-containing protein n=1 Tax=Paenibacillus sp. DYY-L-2 TaxID=3447013 RepID=UPI003F4FCB90
MSGEKDRQNFHIELNNGQAARERGLIFAEFDLGGSSEASEKGQGVAEPVISRIVEPDTGERELDFRQQFRYVSREQQFVQKARELEWKSGDPAEFVPFQTYWPTYDEMQPRQLSWYLHWRGEVRSGRYPDTDLSYLFVYLYELIHGVGWEEPAQGYELMERVWLGYRERYPKLDGYVREWLYDLGLAYKLDLEPSLPMRKLPRSMSPELKELEWKRRFSAEPLALEWDMLLQLIDYEVEKSRFYAERGRKELREYVPKVVTLVDGYLGKIQGQRLLERFMPREKTATRYLFRSAVYDHDLYGRTVTVTMLPISGHLPLRAYLTQLVRLTENKLRELTGFKGKLRGIEVEPEVEQLVHRFLHKEFEQRKAAEAKKSIPAVKINAAKLRQLQRESDEVRDMLLTEDPPGAAEERGRVAEDRRPEGSGRRKAPNGPVQAEFDFERGWIGQEEERAAKRETEMPALLDDRDQVPGKVAQAAVEEHRLEMYSGAQGEEVGAAVSVGFQDDESAAGAGGVPNEAAEAFDSVRAPSEEAGTIVSSGVQVEKAEGVFVFAGSEDEAARTENPGEAPEKALPPAQLVPDIFDDSGVELEEEWRALGDRLSEVHFNILAIMLNGEGSAERQRIAEQAGSMPELLMDEINEAAMDVIGDLLIDGDEIAEDYMGKVEGMWRAVGR